MARIPHIDEPRLALPVSDRRDHLRGNLTAPVTIVEYGDFECPHCGRAHFIVNDLLDQAGDEICFAFRHFPLAQIHPHAFRAAEAAEAAGAQERFWEMHDTLFENQDALDDESLLEYALALDLDVRRVEAELNKGVHTARVREDFITGARSGVNGTPTFFINGRRHDGPWDLASLANAINMEMEEAKKGHSA
jgi:protein-disulfide isomerase